MLTNRNLRKLARYSKNAGYIVGNPKVQWSRVSHYFYTKFKLKL